MVGMMCENLHHPGYRTLVQEYKYAGIPVYRCCNDPPYWRVTEM